jgi:hypothetical protein
MFAIIVGLVLALILFGLPLGIIGLFVVSILDQKSFEVDNIPRDAPTSESRRASKHRFDYRRAIVGTVRYK